MGLVALGARSTTAILIETKRVAIEKPAGVNRRAGIRFVIGATGWRRVRSDGHAPLTIRSPLPAGGQLITLRDAANYITKLPKAEQDAPQWRAAIEALMLVADRGGPTMFARIGVMRALNLPPVGGHSRPVPAASVGRDGPEATM